MKEFLKKLLTYTVALSVNLVLLSISIYGAFYTCFFSLVGYIGMVLFSGSLFYLGRDIIKEFKK